MRDAVARLQLDLSGITVVTEAGTGVFALTPVIAAMAGARVIAVTRDSAWGTAVDVAETVAVASRAAKVDRAVEVTEDRLAALSRADLVTNLGFVRPLDRDAIHRMPEGTIIALMCEGWEIRPEDLDLAACGARGITVLGTNEHHPLCSVFRYSGPLAGQLLMEAGCELLGARIAVVGRDAFAVDIVSWLRSAGADATSVVQEGAVRAEAVAGADAILVCDYAAGDVVVGREGFIAAEWLARHAPGAVVVQFAGRIDREAITDAGLECWPAAPVGAHRMVRTFSALGPVPVIDLHAGGLKVGEIGVRCRSEANSPRAVEELAIRASSLVQRVAPLERQS